MAQESSLVRKDKQGITADAHWVENGFQIFLVSKTLKVETAWEKHEDKPFLLLFHLLSSGHLLCELDALAPGPAVMWDWQTAVHLFQGD